MNNVVEFKKPSKTPENVAVQREPEGEVLEFRVTAIMITISWLVQAGRANEAERLFGAVRSGGYGVWTLLPAELSKLVDEADYEIGIYGRTEDDCVD